MRRISQHHLDIYLRETPVENMYLNNRFMTAILVLYISFHRSLTLTTQSTTVVALQSIRRNRYLLVSLIMSSCYIMATRKLFSATRKLFLATSKLFLATSKLFLATSKLFSTRSTLVYVIVSRCAHSSSTFLSKRTSTMIWRSGGTLPDVSSTSSC